MSINIDTLANEVIELLERQTYDVEEETQISDTEVEIETVTRNISIGVEQKALIKAQVEAIMNHLLKNEVSNPEGTTGTSNYAVIKSDSDEDSSFFDYINKVDTLVTKLNTFIAVFVAASAAAGPGSGGVVVAASSTPAAQVVTAIAAVKAAKPTSIMSRIDS